MESGFLTAMVEHKKFLWFTIHCRHNKNLVDRRPIYPAKHGNFAPKYVPTEPEYLYFIGAVCCICGDMKAMDSYFYTFTMPASAVFKEIAAGVREWATHPRKDL